MTMPMPKKPWVRGGLLAGFGAITVALACWAPGPTDASNDEGVVTAEEASPGEVGLDQERPAVPTFTPYTVIPALKNPEEVVAALEREYPTALKAEGIGGTVSVWFFVDEESQVRRLQVNQSSGFKALDDAAVGVANVVKFTPALNRDKRMPVWVSLPIVFTTDENFQVEAPESGPVAERTRGRIVSSGQTSSEDGPFGAVSGTATDEATGQPLPFTQVFVVGTKRGTLSNQEGRFLIEHVPAGDREIVAIMIGFSRELETVSVPAGGRAEVNFGLRLTAIDLEALVVRVSGEDE